jgi:HPt (histidine-containing phosphotransfer) domain-containing protein
MPWKEWFTMADNVVYIDFADGLKRMMNNTKLYVKLLTKFNNDTKIDPLLTALAEEDMENAQNAAHTLKGVAANLSLSELFKQCLELENQIKAKVVEPNQTETVKTVFATTIEEVNEVISKYA